MGYVTLSPFDLTPDCELDGPGTIRLFYSTNFTSEGVNVVYSTPYSDNFFGVIDWHINEDGGLTTSTGQLVSTVNSTDPQATVTGIIYDANGNPQPNSLFTWHVPNSLAPLTYEELIDYNLAYIPPPPVNSAWVDVTNSLIQTALGSRNYAAVNTLGLVYTATDPPIASHPTAVLTDDPRLGSQFYITSYGALASASAATNATAIAAAVTAANLVGGSVVVPRGTFNTNSVTISAPLVFEGAGAILAPASGQTITITKSVFADVSQHFSNAVAGQGTISFLGNYALQTVYPEWWGASPSASAATNTPLCLAAIVATGTGRTNASGNWIYNRKLHHSGIYQINGEFAVNSYIGFQWTSENKFNSGYKQTATNTKIINGQSIAYGYFDQILFTTSVAQNTSLVGLDYDGTTTSGDLRPQNITFQDCVFTGNSSFGSNVGYIGVQIAKSGGSAQGDNIRFYNCYANGFSQAAVMLGDGVDGTAITDASNAIHVQWEGGDLQGNLQYGLCAFGGSFLVDGPTCENGQVTSANGLEQSGCDFYSEASQNINIVRNVRSESVRFAAGAWDIYNCTALGPATTFTLPWASLPGINSFTNQLVTGTPYGGDGYMYRVTSATVLSSYADIVAPFNAPSFSTPNWTLNFNVTGPLAPGALVGETLVIRYPNCFPVYTVVTANGATDITVTSLSEIFTPGDVSPAQTCGAHTQYATVISVPTFGGLADTIATGGSATTIVVALAGWGVDEWVGQRVTIMSGTGRYQYGDITSNTADTITCSGGWKTQFQISATTGLPMVIVSPAAGSHFVIEPIWNQSVITSGSVSMTALDIKVLDASVGGTAFTGDVNNFNGGYGTRVLYNGGTISNSQFTRSDWFTSNAPVFETPFPLTRFDNIQVVRYGANANEYWPWSIPAESGYSHYYDWTQNQQGSQKIVWSRSDGAGVPFADLSIGPSRYSLPYSSGDSNSVNVIEVQGTLGAPTVQAVDSDGAPQINVAGAATRIQGGLSRGNVASGDVEFWIGAAGASGSQVNPGAKKAWVSTDGLHVGTGQLISTLTPGTAPLVIASTTKVSNLNVDSLDGADWSATPSLTPDGVGTRSLGSSSLPYLALSLGSAAGQRSALSSNATGNRSAVFPDANTVIPIVAQVVTIAGPSTARTYTFPDAAATIARTDAGQTFTGNQTFSDLVIETEGAVLSVTSNTITPTDQIHHVGAGLIKTITVPAGFTSGTIWIIPDAAFTYDNTGNILVPAGGGTAVVNKVMTFTYSSSSSKWIPSY